MNLAHVLDEQILARVDKPSRYLGNEVNAVHKRPEDVEVRLALAFPDLYDLGLGNLGGPDQEGGGGEYADTEDERFDEGV